MAAIFPVDVVVAGTTSDAVLYELPVACVGRVGVGFLVAGFAVSDILREYNVAVVMQPAAEADDRVAVYQLLAVVDLVHHHFHVDRVAGVFVGRKRVVTGDAVGHVGARATVELEAIVAGVAGVVVDDIARKHARGGTAKCRDEVIDAVGGDRRLAADLDAEAMRLVGIEGRAGRVGIRTELERVFVGAVAIVDQRTLRAALRGCLRIGNTRARTGHVGLPFARAAAAGHGRGEL